MSKQQRPDKSWWWVRVIRPKREGVEAAFWRQPTPRSIGYFHLIACSSPWSESSLEIVGPCLFATQAADLDRATKILRRALQAFRRPQWKDGPTDNEVMDEIVDFLAQLKLDKEMNKCL